MCALNAMQDQEISTRFRQNRHDSAKRRIRNFSETYAKQLLMHDRSARGLSQSQASRGRPSP
jgi:hypothetical protein